MKEKLFSAEEISKRRNESNRELTAKNERVISSMKRVLKLQDQLDFKPEKAKKVKEFEIWCDDLNAKKSKLLQELNKYTDAVENTKEELYRVIARKDKFEDEITDLQEEISRLKLQVEFNRNLIKQYA